MDRARIEQIKNSYQIENIVARYVPLRRSGRAWRARCPFHDDEHPSFYVYPDTQSFYCFGCGAYGDVFKFLMQAEGLTFGEALRQLGGLAPTLPKPVPPPLHLVLQPPPFTLEASHLVVLTAATRLYHQQLLACPEAIAWIYRRGLDDAAIRRHQIGYVHGRTLRAELVRQGYNPRYAREVGLLSRKDEHLRGRIVVPELRSGQAHFLIGRAPGDGSAPKYLGLPIPKPLYGVDYIQNADEIWVTEGVFDWLTLITWGYPAVALLGTHLNPALHAHFDRARRIYVVMDTDAAGRAAEQRLRRAFGGRARVIRLPESVKDVNELAQQPAGQETFAWLAEMIRVT